MTVISPLYHKAKAQHRFNILMNIGLIAGMFIALHLIW